MDDPILYGPDGRPLQSKDENKDSVHTTPKKRGWAITWATPIGGKIPILWRSTLSRILALAATLLSIVVLYPRVSVTPGEDYGNPDPLHIYITVSNNGQFSIYSCALTCTIDQAMNLTEHRAITRTKTNEATNFPIGTLEGGGYTTTICPSAIGFLNPRDNFYGHVTVVLYFRPSFWPLQVQRTFYIRGATESDGRIHWHVTSQ
jgi:hypothetical protein